MYINGLSSKRFTYSEFITPIHMQLMQKQQDLKKKVRVTFSGEPGLDMGGLTKEWFLLLIKEVFQPEYGIKVLLIVMK